MTVVCIAGMHRSGTSMIARMLNLCGIYLGEEIDLMPPALDNPEGFWENIQFVNINDKILSRLGGGWDVPPAMESGWENSSAIAQLQPDAKALIRKFSTHDHWGWKDPRNSLTLAFWQKLIPDLKVVVCVRHPLDVSRSLERRGSSSLPFAMQLWREYYHRVFSDTSDQNRLITNYDSYFLEDTTELRRVLSFLKIRIDDQGISNASHAANVSLNHGRDSLKEKTFLEGYPEVDSLYSQLCAQAGPEYQRYLKAQPSKIKTSPPVEIDKKQTDDGNEKRLIESLRIRLLQNTHAIHALELQLIDNNQTELRLNEKVNAAEQNTKALSDQLTGKDQIIKTLSEQVKEKEQAIRVLSGQVSEKEQIARALTGKIIEKEQTIQSLSVEVTEKEQTIQSLSEQATEKEQTVEALSAQLANTNQALQSADMQLQTIFNTRAWRLIQILWKIRVFLVPHHSRRAKAIKKVISGVRRIANSFKPKRDIPSQPGTQGKPPQTSESKLDPAPIDTLVDKVGRLYAKPGLKSPTASIIIPVYNQIEFTLNCLLSIPSGASRVSYEIIVIDDGSTDRTPLALRNIKGLRYFRNNGNIGFLMSCNEAARKAKGEYLVFLNNDTKVHPGWLENLASVFSIFPNAGMAGAKLILPNGRLQEAGSVIGSDGSAENYGREQDPRHYKYNFVREADYVSGASIILPRKLWESLGGFDIKYTPAYYEDVDLAYRIRKAGYKVYFQPFANVTHFEGGTSGVDVKTGIKHYQVINRKTFFDTWKNDIAGNGALAETPDYIKSNRFVNGRILFIDDGTPKPDHYAGGVLSEAYIGILREAGYAVTLLPHIDLRHADGYTEVLQKKGVECVYLPYESSSEQYIRQNGNQFDFVIISRANVASELIDPVKKYAPQAKILFNTIDLHSVRELRAAQLSGKKSDLLDARRTQDGEISVIKKADCTLVVSDAEQKFLAELLPESKVAVVPFPAEVCPSRKSYQERKDIVFLGGFMHRPNFDAVLFFADEIWPQISKALPGVRFIIGGGEGPQEIWDLASDTIVVKGFVEDLAGFFGTARVSVAPLRFGAGIKGKILSSLAHGTPCVATGIASEGTGLIDGMNVLIADTPGEFSDAVIKAYTSPDLWASLSKNGQDWIQSHYSRPVIASKLLDVINRM